jgi:GcrA cell cycle regulator
VAAHGTWTDERSDKVAKLWAEGLSASAIAMQIGGVSRNAVIGRIHRMGLSGRATIHRIKRTGDNVRRLRSRRKRLQTVTDYMEAARLGDAHYAAHAGPDLDIPEAERVQRLDDLEPHHCRWPYGDGPFTFCGQAKLPGKSYCEFHTLRSLPAPQAGYSPPRNSGSNNPMWRQKSLGVKDPVGSLYPVDLRALDIVEKEPA